MAESATVRAQLEEQRCLIEDQQIELKRQRRQIKLQVPRIALVQVELDGIKATWQRAAPVLQPTERRLSQSNGNGHSLRRDRKRDPVSISNRP